MKLLSLFLSTFVILHSSFASAADRPNILWLTSEDHGPHMGCYGDTYATTPNVDALAAKGDTAGARSAYREALNKTPADAPNRSYLQIKLDALGGES